MKAQITILKTKVRMQKERLSGLENQLLIVREALEREQNEKGELEQEIAYQKSKVSRRDKQIAELKKLQGVT